MIKKVAPFLMLSLFLINASGCVAIVAGAAGGAGTSAWLSGKLTQEVNATFDRSVDAAKSTLKSLKF